MRTANTMNHIKPAIETLGGGYSTGLYTLPPVWIEPTPGVAQHSDDFKPLREVQPVPEPAEWLVLGTGVILVLLMTRRGRVLP
jgi:hypothetical protein